MTGRRFDKKAGALTQSLVEIAKMQELPPLLDLSKCVLLKKLSKAHKGKINKIRRTGVEQ